MAVLFKAGSPIGDLRPDSIDYRPAPIIDPGHKHTAGSLIGFGGGALPAGTGSPQVLVWNGTAWSGQTMSGDASISSGGVLTLANTAVTPGSYGDLGDSATVIFDSKGRATFAANTPIQIALGPSRRCYVVQGQSSVVLPADNTRTRISLANSDLVANQWAMLGPTAVLPLTPTNAYPHSAVTTTQTAGGGANAVTVTSVAGIVPGMIIRDVTNPGYVNHDTYVTSVDAGTKIVRANVSWLTPIGSGDTVQFGPDVAAVYISPNAVPVVNNTGGAPCAIPSGTYYQMSNGDLLTASSAVAVGAGLMPCDRTGNVYGIVWDNSGTAIAAWSNVTAYTAGTFVTSGGHVYRCILGNTNQTPPNATYWQDIGAGSHVYSVTLPAFQSPELLSAGTVVTIAGYVVSGTAPNGQLTVALAPTQGHVTDVEFYAITSNTADIGTITTYGTFSYAPTPSTGGWAGDGTTLNMTPWDPVLGTTAIKLGPGQVQNVNALAPFGVVGNSLGPSSYLGPVSMIADNCTYLMYDSLHYTSIPGNLPAPVIAAGGIVETGSGDWTSGDLSNFLATYPAARFMSFDQTINHDYSDILDVEGANVNETSPGGANISNAYVWAALRAMRGGTPIFYAFDGNSTYNASWGLTNLQTALSNGYSGPGPLYWPATGAAIQDLDVTAVNNGSKQVTGTTTINPTAFVNGAWVALHSIYGTTGLVGIWQMSSVNVTGPVAGLYTVTFVVSAAAPAGTYTTSPRSGVATLIPASVFTLLQTAPPSGAILMNQFASAGNLANAGTAGIGYDLNIFQGSEMIAQTWHRAPSPAATLTNPALTGSVAGRGIFTFTSAVAGGQSSFTAPVIWTDGLTTNGVVQAINANALTTGQAYVIRLGAVTTGAGLLVTDRAGMAAGGKMIWIQHLAGANAGAYAWYADTGGVRKSSVDAAGNAYFAGSVTASSISGSDAITNDNAALQEMTGGLAPTVLGLQDQSSDPSRVLSMLELWSRSIANDLSWPYAQSNHGAAFPLERARFATQCFDCRPLYNSSVPKVEGNAMALGSGRGLQTATWDATKGVLQGSHASGGGGDYSLIYSDAIFQVNTASATGGFFYYARVNIDALATPGANQGVRYLFGLSPDFPTALQTSNISTRVVNTTAFVGFAYLNMNGGTTDGNFGFQYQDGSHTPDYVSTGVAVTAGHTYDLFIWCPAGSASGTVYWQIQDRTAAGSIVTGSSTGGGHPITNATQLQCGIGVYSRGGGQAYEFQYMHFWCHADGRGY